MALSRSGRRQVDYARAIREVMTPTEVRAVVREMRAVALGVDPADGSPREYEQSDRRAAAELVLIHTKGRPGTAAPDVDPLELPEVRDAGSALEAYARIIDAVAKGDLCADSAQLYRQLVSDAAKIALANRTVNLLAAGGAPTFTFTDEMPLDEQLERQTEFVRDALLARMSHVPASPEGN